MDNTKRPKKSQDIEIFYKGQEATINLHIDSIKETPKIIKGIIEDKATYTPINGACIKITDKSYNPICHSYSNSEGHFFIGYVFPPQIRIVSIKEGYETFSSYTYSIDDPELCNINILLRSKKCEGSIIVGVLSDQYKSPAANVIVSLKNEYDDTVYETFSNDEGYFVFENVKCGFYMISFCSYCFSEYSYHINVRGQKKLLDLGSITLERIITDCTINGLILDSNTTLPINNAVVILYDALSNTPLKVTYTNKGGVYIFYGLKVGKYFILAK